MKKEAHCCLEKRRVRGTLILNYLGREGETEDWEKREFPGSAHEG
jgi:hypothetical protein